MDSREREVGGSVDVDAVITAASVRAVLLLLLLHPHPLCAVGVVLDPLPSVSLSLLHCVGVGSPSSPSPSLLALAPLFHDELRRCGPSDRADDRLHRAGGEGEGGGDPGQDREGVHGRQTQPRDAAQVHNTHTHTHTHPHSYRRWSERQRCCSRLHPVAEHLAALPRSRATPPLPPRQWAAWTARPPASTVQRTATELCCAASLRCVLPA